jgi:hypothetical protein
MAILLRVQQRTAILRRGQWLSSDADLERLLNDTMNAWIGETGGPALSDADPEFTAARETAQRVAGRVVLRVAAGRKGQRVYADRRQMSFKFDRAISLSRMVRRKVAASK